jgi:fatty acid desaturase
LERLFIAPFWVHYHCEHHCFMYVPCYNLEKTHKLLVEKGFRERMRITKGYADVLRRCGSKADQAPAAA